MNGQEQRQRHTAVKTLAKQVIENLENMDALVAETMLGMKKYVDDQHSSVTNLIETTKRELETYTDTKVRELNWELVNRIAHLELQFTGFCQMGFWTRIWWIITGRLPFWINEIPQLAPPRSRCHICGADGDEPCDAGLHS